MRLGNSLEMLVLLHLLLQAKHLPLQLVPQAGQGVPDVIGQLGVQLLLQVRRPALVRHVPVCRMGQEELSFSGHCSLDVLLSVNVFLTPVDDAHVASPEGQQPVLKNIPCVSSLVHQIKFGQDTDGSVTWAAK